MIRCSTMLLLAAALAACGDDVQPILAGAPDRPVVLDSVSGDSVLAYHPTLPDSVATPPPPRPPPPPVDTAPPVPVSGFRFVSAQQQANWQALRATNDPLYRLAVANCALTATSGERYADSGLWCAWIAVVNNDSIAAAKSVRKLKGVSIAASQNTVREALIEVILHRDLLGAWLTDADRAVIDPVLTQWASRAASQLGSDSDVMVGMGCGALLWQLAGGAPVPAAVLPTLTRYVNTARDGVWIESSHYNIGTLLLFTMCNRSIQVATGQEVVPGATAMLYNAGKAQALEMTPDLRQSIQWGDVEGPRDLRLFRRVTLFHTFEHPWAVSTLASLYTRYGRTGYGSAEPWARALLYADPARVAQPIPTDVSHLAASMGQLFWRRGTTLSWAMAMPRTGVQHTSTTNPFDLQMYRDGEWVLTHPVMYSVPLNEVTPNTPLYAGLGIFLQSGMTWADSGGGWRAIAGQSSGSYFTSNYPSPPAFLRSGHRVVVFAEEAGFDVAVVRDSVDMTDPRILARYTSYRSTGTYLHQQRIVEFEGAPWSNWHTPVAPTVTGNLIAWTTPGAQSASITAFADAPIQTITVDETSYLTGTIEASENRRQTRVRNPGVLYQVFLAGQGTPPAVSRQANTITVGSRTFTITTAGVVVQ